MVGAGRSVVTDVSIGLSLTAMPSHGPSTPLLLLGPLLALTLPRLAVASIHVDSINGETIHFSPSEAREISDDLIGALDLDHVRSPQRLHRERRRQDERNSVPTFMMDVYDELQAAADDTDQPLGDWRKRFNSPLKMRYNVSTWIENSLFAADLIVSVPQDETFKASSWEDRQRRLVFRFDHLPSRHQLSVLTSELRIFRHEFAYAGEKMKLMLNRVKAEPNKAPVSVETLGLDLVPGQTGWIEVNITSFVRHWMEKPHENAGIYLRLLNARGMDLPPDLLGFETERNKAFSPFVVASYRSGPELKRRRVRRSADRYREKRQHKVRRSSYRRHQRRTCSRRKLEVNFKDLRWDEWVIAPPIYNAFYCSGECSFPLNPRWNITNHSIVQTFYSLNQRNRVIPKPCCVPIKLKSMKMLYFDRESRVVLRNYDKMVVESCGCH